MKNKPIRYLVYSILFSCSVLGTYWAFNPSERIVKTIAKPSQVYKDLNCSHEQSKAPIVDQQTQPQEDKAVEIEEPELKPIQQLCVVLGEDLSKSEHQARALSLAQQSTPILKTLIQTDPDKAYQYALSAEDWQVLPEELKPFIGRRFEEKAMFIASTNCEAEERHLSYKSDTIGTSLVATGKKVQYSDGVLNARVSGVAFENYVGIVAMEGGTAIDPSNPATFPQPAYENPYVYTPYKYIPVPKFGTLKVLYLLVKFSDGTSSPTSEDLSRSLLNSVASSFNKFSYGKLTMVYDVVRVSIPGSSNADDYTVLEQTAAAAYALGYNPDNYHVICRRNSDRGNYAFLNTKDNFIKRDNDDTILHEMGHNLGLNHANSWRPKSYASNGYSDGDNLIYGENWDAMANGPRGDFNAYEKMQFRWLWYTGTNSDYAENPSDAIYRIYPYDNYKANFNNTAGVNGVHYAITIFKDTKAVNGQEADREYVLSYRNQPEWDDNSYNAFFQEGLLLHWKPWTLNGTDGYNSNASFGTCLVDANRATNDQIDSAIFIGNTFVDSASGNRDGNLYITPLRKVNPDGIFRNGDEYIDVKIARGSQSTNLSPSASWTYSDTTISPGDTVNFAVTASDPDDTQLGYYWDFGLGTDSASRKLMPLNGLPNQTFTYKNEGVYVATCIVTDGRGKTVKLTQTIHVDVTPPVAPAGLVTTHGSPGISLDWTDNAETDVASYTIYRRTTGGSYSAPLATGVTASNYLDTTTVNGTTYHYVVKAVDINTNQSSFSNESSFASLPITNLSIQASSNSFVQFGSGIQTATQTLGVKGNTWGNLSRIAYIRFPLTGNDEIGGVHIDKVTSVALNLHLTSNQGSDTMTVYALVDGAQASSAYLTESSWTGGTNGTSAGGNNLQANKRPDGEVAIPNAQTTASLCSYTFAGTSAVVNNDIGTKLIPITSMDVFRTLVKNDTNGQITLVVKSSLSSGVNLIASLYNTNGQLVPTLKVDALIAPVDTTPPSAPVGLAASAPLGSVNLDWADNTEADVASYSIYRRTMQGSYGAPIATGVTYSNYLDTTTSNGTTYYYVVKAVDSNSNESIFSNESSSTPQQIATINLQATSNSYVHYGNGIQSATQSIAIKADTWAYNSRMAYIRFPLTGNDEIAGVHIDKIGSVALNVQVTSNQGGDTLSIYALLDRAQAASTDLTEASWTGGTNGTIAGGNNLEASRRPDGDVTVPNARTTSILASYTFAGTSSVVNNDIGTKLIPITSMDVFRNLVKNDTNGEITFVIKGSLVSGVNFIASVYNTNGQLVPTLKLEGVDTTPPAAPSGLVTTASSPGVTLDWADNTEPDFTTYNIYRSTIQGSYGAPVATGLTSSNYLDTTPVNGTTYYYAVKAVDLNANESSFSNQSSFTPQPISNLNLQATSNAYVQFGNGILTANQILGVKVNTWGNLSRIAYIRFPLTGNDEIAGVHIDKIASVALNVHITSNQGADTMSVYALVDNAQASSTYLTETTWTGGTDGTSAGGNNLQANKRPDGEVAIPNTWTTASLGSYTFAGTTAVVNNDIGTKLIPITSMDVFRNLVKNDTNGQITFVIKSSLALGVNVMASLYNTNGQLVPTLKVDAQIAPVDTTPPAAPSGLTASVADGSVNLDWTNHSETDFASYKVYRKTSSGSYSTALITGLSSSLYADATGVARTLYGYQVTAVDSSGNESQPSNEVTAFFFVDTDNDGIDDSWENQYFNSIASNDGSADSDGDGVLDFFEYLYGSNPNNSPARGFSISADTADLNVFFSWEVLHGFELGTHFRAEVSTNLRTWSVIPPANYNLEKTTLGDRVQMKLTPTYNYGDSLFLRLSEP
jgi:fibronectin type 3 domain-containing protein